MPDRRLLLSSIALLLALVFFAQGTLQHGRAAISFSEDFDGVTAPNLPSGWSSVIVSTSCGTGDTNAWVTTTTTPDSPPNAAYTTNATCNDDRALESPAISTASNLALTFRHKFGFDDFLGFFDGGVLEIKIDDGAWQDIIDAGGSFQSGGYNGQLNGGENQPLGTRFAWVSVSEGFETVCVTLPAGLNEADEFRLRWRRGAGDTIGGAGWWVDSIVIDDAGQCLEPTPTSTATPTATPTPTSVFTSTPTVTGTIPPTATATATATPTVAPAASLVPPQPGANVGGAAGAIVAASDQARQNREAAARAAASTPAQVRAPGTGDGINIAPPSTGEAGLNAHESRPEPALLAAALLGLMLLWTARLGWRRS